MLRCDHTQGCRPPRSRGAEDHEPAVAARMQNLQRLRLILGLVSASEHQGGPGFRSRGPCPSGQQRVERQARRESGSPRRWRRRRSRPSLRDPSDDVVIGEGDAHRQRLVVLRATEERTASALRSAGKLGGAGGAEHRPAVRSLGDAQAQPQRAVRRERIANDPGGALRAEDQVHAQGAPPRRDVGEHRRQLCVLLQQGGELVDDDQESGKVGLTHVARLRRREGTLTAAHLCGQAGDAAPRLRLVEVREDADDLRQLTQAIEGRPSFEVREEDTHPLRPVPRADGGDPCDEEFTLACPRHPRHDRVRAVLDDVGHHRGIVCSATERHEEAWAHRWLRKVPERHRRPGRLRRGPFPAAQLGGRRRLRRRQVLDVHPVLAVRGAQSRRTGFHDVDHRRDAVRNVRTGRQGPDHRIGARGRCGLLCEGKPETTASRLLHVREARQRPVPRRVADEGEHTRGEAETELDDERTCGGPGERLRAPQAYSSTEEDDPRRVFQDTAPAAERSGALVVTALAAHGADPGSASHDERSVVVGRPGILQRAAAQTRGGIRVPTFLVCALLRVAAVQLRFDLCPRGVHPERLGSPFATTSAGCVEERRAQHQRPESREPERMHRTGREPESQTDSHGDDGGDDGKRAPPGRRHGGREDQGRGVHASSGAHRRGG